MTNTNNPSVKIVMGRDIICTIGFINVLIRARTTHTSIALKKFSTLMPGIIQATKIMASVYAIHLKNKFNIFYPFCFFFECKIFLSKINSPNYLLNSEILGLLGDFYQRNKFITFIVTHVVFWTLLCIMYNEFKIIRVKNTIIID